MPLEEAPTTAWEAPYGNGCKAYSLLDGQGPYVCECCAIAKLKTAKQPGNSPGEQRLITCMNQRTASRQVVFFLKIEASWGISRMSSQAYFNFNELTFLLERAEGSVL